MFSKKSRCYNGGNQHKFVPRFTEKQNTSAVHTKGLMSVNGMRDLLYYKEYLFDVCEWCGKRIKDEGGDV